MAGTTPAVNSTATLITPIPSDLTSPSIAVRRITDTSAWDNHAKLDRTANNWTTWSQNVLLVMQMCGLDLYLTGEVPNPDPAIEPRANSNWRTNDTAVRAFLMSKCSATELSVVKACKSALSIWTTLQSRHECQGTVSQIQLIQEAFSIEYSTSIPFSETSERLRVLNERIWAMGTPTPDTFLVILMVRALTSTDLRGVQDAAITGLASATTSSPYTAAHICARLDLEQQVRHPHTQRSTSVTGEALAAKSDNSRSPTFCANCKRTNHVADFCIRKGGGMAGKSLDDAVMAQREKRKGKKPQQKPVEPTSQTSSLHVPSTSSKPNTVLRDVQNRAYIVDPATHMAYLVSEAPQAPSPEAHFTGLATDSIDDLVASAMTPGDYEEYANAAWLNLHDELETSVDWTTSTVPVDLCAVSVSPVTPVKRLNEVSLTSSPFLLDSGCTTHLSPERSDFLHLKPIANRLVKGVNGSSIPAIGIGSIRLVVGRGAHITLDNVLYIPSSTVRLLSVACLIDSLRCDVAFSLSGVSLKSPSGALLASGSRLPNRNLFQLDCSRLFVEHALLGQPLPTLDTWHRRLGHANPQAIYDLATKDLAEGMPVDLSARPPKCDHCILGKQVRSTVPSHRAGEKSARKLGIIWVDLTGPEAVESASGKRYLMNIVDDHTSYPWSFPLRNKSDALPTLQAWAKRTENQCGERIGIIRMDGGELKSDAMTTWCDANGYTTQFTAPYTSAHIGRVERMHRTIMSKMRTMRVQTGMPTNRWDELAMTASYLSARTPTKSLGKTPHEAWFGTKPDLSHLREIGCRAFVLIQDKHNPKIYARSYECVLIGYSQDSKAYRLYHRKSGKVVQSFHVKFIERKDAEPGPLFPGRVVSTSNPTSPRHVPVEDEDDVDAPIPPDPALPLQPLFEPLDDPAPMLRPAVTPAKASNTAPPLIPPAPPQLRCSCRGPIPSNWKALLDGVEYTSATERAVAESKESSRRLHEQRITSRDERRRAQLEMREQLREPNDTLTEPPVVQPTASLSNLPFATEDEVGLLDEVFAASLASPLVNAEFPSDPVTLREALGSTDADSWRAGIQEELKSLSEMGVYKLVPRSSVPAGRKILRGKWVFRLKRNENGEPVRYKARLVVKGFEQVFGQDYVDTTSPTARMESLCLVLHLAAVNNWEIQQVDIKTAYLYGLLSADEVVYMEQPRGFADPGKEDWVWELQRGLYGMKQSGRIWNKTMNKALLSWGFKCLVADPCVYYRHSKSGTILTAIHVDDFLIAGSSPEVCATFKAQLKTLWSISDLGNATFCVGIAISRDRAACTVSLSQTALIDRVVSTFGQAEAYPISTPMDSNVQLRRPTSDESLSASELSALAELPYRSLVGSLMYLAVGTRPDISYAVSKLTQFLDCYRHSHWAAALRVVRYLKGTRTLSLLLGNSSTISLVGFSDSSYADCLDTRRSCMGYCFSLGGAVFSWSSRKQKTVACSTCDAEYIAVSESCREALWLRSFLRELGLLKDDPTTLLCDNNGAMALSNDPTLHSRSKHIDVRHHFIREHVETGSIDLARIPSADNLADVFTKALPRPAFERFRSFLGLC